MIETSQTSDGYHTFGELYQHRNALFLALMKAMPENSWISRFLSDGEVPFGDPEWFIAGISLPSLSMVARGTSFLITYHLPSTYWMRARRSGAKVLPQAPEWDGHTPQDVVERLLFFVNDSFGRL